MKRFWKSCGSTGCDDLSGDDPPSGCGFLAPAKRGRGGSGAARDGEGDFTNPAPPLPEPRSTGTSVACRQAKLVIELDGSQHVDSGYDKCRDEFMRASGYSVLRFWSGDALKNIGAVCETILAVLDGRLIGDIVSTDLKFVFARTEQSGRECK